MHRFDIYSNSPEDSRIDDSHHASLTVFALRAVIPDGFGVVDQDRVRRSRRCIGFDRHESREKACDGRVDIVDRNTRLVECRLHNRMILEFWSGTAGSNKGETGTHVGPKLKLNQLSGLYLEIVGLEYQFCVLG